MKFYKKCSIALLGIVILTYVVIKVYEDEILQEGMGIPAFVSPPNFILGALGYKVPMDMATSATETGRDFALYGAESAQSAGETVVLSTQAGALAVADSAQSAAETTIQMGQSTAEAIADSTQSATETTILSGQDFSLESKATLERIVSNTDRKADTWIDRAGHMLNITYVTLFFLFILTFIGYIVLICEWFVKASKCAFVWFKNFRECFFWYFLEIIGQILYLPFRFIIWAFDSWFGISTPKEIEKQVWKTMHWVSCKCYDYTNFHLIYYPQDVIKKCYGCTAGKFPSPSEHFKKTFTTKDPVKGIKRFFTGSE